MEIENWKIINDVLIVDLSLLVPNVVEISIVPALKAWIEGILLEIKPTITANAIDKVNTHCAFSKEICFPVVRLKVGRAK